MTRLTLVSLDDTVVFPGMPVTLALDPGSEKYISLMPRHGNGYAKVGVVAEVTERVHLPGRGSAVSLVGRYRAVPGAAQTGSDGRLKNFVRSITEPGALADTAGYVILPERNEPDLDDLPADVREQMHFHPVGSIDEVLALALEPSEVAVCA